MAGIVILIGLMMVIAYIWWFTTKPEFGGRPSLAQFDTIKHSQNFRNGQFHNLEPTPMLAENSSWAKVTREYFFSRLPDRKPNKPIPSIKTDLLALPPNDVLVWFGHSSYLLKVDGFVVLVDPVFSGNASPIAGTTKSFEGTDVFKAVDLPHIDLLIITHDHWDHLDYKTIMELSGKVSQTVTGLGVGAHIMKWGLQNVNELDWKETFQLNNDVIITGTPARHFSGRGFRRNATLWMSFVLKTRTKKIYIGGDSGYGSHFKSIGTEHSPFDLAILENGQYNDSWKYIHMLPEEVVQAAIDLQAKLVLPVHWGKFMLSLHAWNEPIIRVAKEAEARGVKLIHPMIGEVVHLNTPETQRWWT
jgi:L-ascorbate metabolism protein UlaG (beta-lactamase superfamily)